MPDRGTGPQVRPRVWIFAGHDPSGGAGVDADAQAVRAAGADPVVCRTADTDQDESGVRAVRPRAIEEWSAEAALALESQSTGALKFGLLPNAAAVHAAADTCRAASARGLPVVVDPVLAPTRGESFLDATGVAALLSDLLSAGPVLTPNIPELARLAEASPSELEVDWKARESAAQRLLARGAVGLVVKGGHGNEDPLHELLVTRQGTRVWRRPRIQAAGIRGSGCRFASFLAARLALGEPLSTAVPAAGEHLAGLIQASRA